MRKQLPTRRPSFNITVEWQGHLFDATYGIDEETGRIGDIFADSRKSGQMRADIRAAATLASLAVQHGADLGTLLGPMERVQAFDGTEHYASPIAEIIAKISDHAAQTIMEADT